MKTLNGIKVVLNEHERPLDHLGSIWYHLEPSDIPYTSNQFLALDLFCHFLQQDGSSFKQQRNLGPE